MNKREQEFESTTDVYSILGRGAVVTGTAFASYEMMKESKASKGGKKYNPRADPLTKRIAELMETSNVTPDFKGLPAHFKSKFFNSVTNTKAQKIKPASLPEITNILGGGFEGKYSTGLGAELQNLSDSMLAVDGRAPSFNYQMHDGQVSSIGVEGANTKLRIPTVRKDGTVIQGKSGQNTYTAKTLWEKKGTSAVQEFGSDVGVTKTFASEYKNIVAGKISPGEIHQAYETTRTYNGKTGSSNANLNEKMQRATANTVMEDPGLNIRGGAMRGDAKKKFLIDKAIEEGSGTSPSAQVKGAYLKSNHPVYETSFLDEAPNPSQAIKPTQLLQDGKTSFDKQINTAFLNEKEMEVFKQVVKENTGKAYSLGEEQAFVRKGFGETIDRTRNISISANGVTQHSESILNRILGITGESADTFSEKVNKSGLSAFSPEQQEQIRNIKLGDYEQGLEAERKGLRSSLKDLRKRSKKEPELTGQIAEKEAKLKRVNEEMKNKNLFGKEQDMMRDKRLTKSHKGLSIDDLSFEDGNINFSLRRQKQFGAGDKISDPAGEMKVIIKDSLNDVQGTLAEVEKRVHGTIAKKGAYSHIDAVANQSTLRPDLTSRNAANILESARFRALAENNTVLLHEINQFDKNYKTMDPNKRTQIFDTIKKVTGQEAVQYAQTKMGVGVSKTHTIAFGNAAIDLGSGGGGSISERNLINYTGLGMTNYTKEVNNSRINKGTTAALLDVNKTQTSINDLKSNKSIKISSLSPYEVQGLFAIDEDNLEDSLAKRKEILKKRGITGTAILDMEREVDGVRKIPLYSDDMYRGFIGAKTGSTEEFRSLSNLDRSTKNIVQELTSPLPDEDRLLNKVKRQKKEHKNMVNSLQKGALAGKVTGGNAGIIDSADEGLDVYADWMAQKHGTKSALDNVATMSDKNFIKEFGQDEYDNVKKTLKEAGISKIGKGTDLSGLKKDVSDAWSMVNRFPDEGNTEMAMNFLPQSAVEGEMIEDSIGVTTRTGKNGITTLSATHGDLDGDMLYSKGAQSRAAKDEIKELAFGNKGQSVAYRKAAMERGKKLIKGKAKKDMRFIPVKERREASILAKYSEKEDISRISDEMQRVRVANIAEGLDSASSYDSKRTLAVANATTFYSENSLKAKHWSTEQLRKKKAIDSIDALKGTNAYERVPIAERKQVFTNYVDELMLGGDAKHANALRAKTVAESTFIEMEKQGFLDARKVHKSGWFQESMSNQVVDDIFNMSKKSDGMGRIVKTAGEMAAEGVGSNAYELNKKKKQLENLGEGAAGFLKKFGGKIGKYAIAPAFAIGAVGSIFGGTGEIKAKEVGGDQYSDGQKRHYGGGHSQQELISAPQMKRPRYENTRIQGGAVASQMNFSQLSGDSKVTLTDNTRNFESHDIQEIIDKGY